MTAVHFRGLYCECFYTGIEIKRTMKLLEIPRLHRSRVVHCTLVALLCLASTFMAQHASAQQLYDATLTQTASSVSPTLLHQNSDSTLLIAWNTDTAATFDDSTGIAKLDAAGNILWTWNLAHNYRIIAAEEYNGGYELIAYEQAKSLTGIGPYEDGYLHIVLDANGLGVASGELEEAGDRDVFQIGIV